MNAQQPPPPWFTLCDPRNGGHPRILDFTPDTTKAFLWWDREIREIREVHTTRNGVQIELER